MRTSPLSALLATLVSSIALVAEPVTYQGRLTDADLPANGTYEMIFKVYTAPTGGDLLATAPTVTVAALDGLIIATPDFPAGTFTGATVYVDISLRHTGTPLYTRLGQRQAITPAPLSMRSLNERWSPLSSSRIATDAGVTSVLINDTAPTRADAALMVTSSTSSGALGGMYVNTSAGTGIPYYGWSANRVNLAEARVDAATNTFLLRSATSEWLRISPEGRVGIGTVATATERLRVNGNIVSVGQVVADDVVAGDDVIATDTSYANAFAYSTPKTRYLSVGPEAFQSPYPHQVGTFGGLGGVAYLDDTAGSGWIKAGVSLPDGAVVTGMDAYVVDNSSPWNLEVSLLRRQFTLGAYSEMAAVESSGPSSSVVTLSDNTIMNATIDNSAYAYNVEVFCPAWQGGAYMYIKGVRIRYTVSEPD